MQDDNLIKELDTQGRIWFRGILNENELALFDKASSLGDRPGARLNSINLLQDVFDQSSSLAIHINQIIPNTRPVRVISFNKTIKNNWGVPWHQDRVIAVKEQHDIKGYSNWSKKVGIWHCEPPIEILKKMLFVQIYLDAADAANGAMEIALGSHDGGTVASNATNKIVRSYNTEICQAKRGDVLVLKMLTLHRSLPSSENSQRRTFRIDYADDILPEPLSFA